MSPALNAEAAAASKPEILLEKKMETSPKARPAGIKDSTTAKIIVIGFLVLGLLIPAAMVRSLIREREHGTVEHLLVMPVTPIEIMMGKVWAMAMVVLTASASSLFIVVQWALQVPIEGSIPLFLAATALHLFATTSLGIFLGTLARTMPQFGLLMMLVLMPLQILSGSVTPRESMPAYIQLVMLAVPNTHFVIIAQAILYRGAGLAVVWPHFIHLALIGGTLFGLSLARFRKSLTAMA